MEVPRLSYCDCDQALAFGPMGLPGSLRSRPVDTHRRVEKRVADPGESDKQKAAFLRIILIRKIAHYLRGRRLAIVSLARSSANIDSLLVDSSATVPGEDIECLHLKMVRVLEALERLQPPDRKAFECVICMGRRTARSPQNWA